MNNSIYITKIKDLVSIDKNRFERIYFGNEFCENLIPSVFDLKKVMNYSKKTNLRLSFITPYLTDGSFNKVKKLLGAVPRGTEIVFNDWGLLDSINEGELRPVMGRLLVKHIRDPLPSKINNPYLKEYFNGSNIQSKGMQKFLISQNIRRIELDNSIISYRLSLHKKLKTSLHYPFVYLTTTRRCPINYSNKAKFLGIPGISCSKECEGTPVKIKHHDYAIWLKGNTQFYINDKKPKDTKGWNLNRFVFSPKMPI